VSWDIYVMKVPLKIEMVDDLPDDFVAPPILSHAELLAAISRIAPGADFTDPAWGTIDGPDYSIEVNVGREDPVTSFALHVHGEGAAATEVVADIIEGLGLKALDAGRDDGRFFSRDRALESFNEWRAYRDEVMGPSSAVTETARSEGGIGNWIRRLLRRD
jgi:hypothetical protein